MMFFGVLFLAVGALASPAIYVPRESLEFPAAAWSWPLRSVTIMDVKDKVAGIPGAPILEPLPLVKAFEIEPLPEPGKEKEEGEKSEEKEDGEMMEGEMDIEKESEKEDEKEMEKDEEKTTEDPKKPVVVKLEEKKIPEFFTNFWTNLQTYFPNFNFPQITFPPIFTKPPLPGTPEADILARYRLAYDYPLLSPTQVRIIGKK